MEDRGLFGGLSAKNTVRFAILYSYWRTPRGGRGTSKKKLEITLSIGRGQGVKVERYNSVKKTRYCSRKGWSERRQRHLGA